MIPEITARNPAGGDNFIGMGSAAQLSAGPEGKVFGINAEGDLIEREGVTDTKQ
jgi:hypothetical protein